MKTITLIICTIFLICISYFNQINKQNSSSESGKLLNLNNPDLNLISETMKQNPDLKNSNVDQGWYQKAIENIQKEEYNISFNETSGEYHSTNRANNLRFIYHENGFTAKSISADSPQIRHRLNEDTKIVDSDWSIDFRVESDNSSLSSPNAPVGDPFMKSESSPVFKNNSTLQVAGNKAFIENENVRIEYTNNEKGMRQDFIVKNKPEGEGNLRLDLSAETELNMNVNTEGIKFTDTDGKEKMSYNSLKVWDANGRELAANFEKSKIQSSAGGLNPKSFSIVVNDNEAVYPITIDPLSTTPNWTADGDQASSNFGLSVSSAGDVNGDGFDDVIIGAASYDNGETNEGKAYVYFGSDSGLTTVADWTAESNQASSNFGLSVSSAGDVNDVGFDDIIIGAQLYDNGETNEGRVYVYLGSASGLSSEADWTAESNVANSYFGRSVSSAGDVNGDGYDDIIIGAFRYSNGESQEGGAFVFYGSSTGLSGTADWSAESNQAGSQFGNSVCTAGDVNGDGYSDVIVGAEEYDNGISNEGSAFVYYGSDTGLSITADWSTESNVIGGRLGTSVSTAGDVNGDGYADVIIGSNHSDRESWVFYGSVSGLSSVADWTAQSNQSAAYFGKSVSTAGDVNGDGFSDVIIGAYWYDNGEYNEGRAFVFYGSAFGLSDDADWIAESNQASAQFGISVSTAGDINGDGFSDVIVGANLYDSSITNQGRAFVYYGSAPTPRSLYLTMLIQGFYDDGSDAMVEDTVTIYIRNGSTPFELVDSAKASLNSSGQATILFNTAENGTDYYIQLSHRNSIETWSKTPQQFTSNALTYDFTTSNTQAYGDNMAEVDTSPLSYAIFSGDEDNNGSVEMDDLMNVYNDALNFVSGYVSSDMNGDNFSDMSDILITYNNSNLFVAKVTP